MGVLPKKRSFADYGQKSATYGQSPISVSGCVILYSVYRQAPLYPLPLAGTLQPAGKKE